MVYRGFRLVGDEMDPSLGRKPRQGFRRGIRSPRLGVSEYLFLSRVNISGHRVSVSLPFPSSETTGKENQKSRGTRVR